MNTIIRFLSRYTFPIVLAVIGGVLWFFLSYLGEGYQASIGPEFIVKLPVKLVFVAAALALLRFLIKFAFPSIHAYTDTQGGQKESEFSHNWKNNPTDPRLWIAIITYLGTLFVISQLFLAAV